MKGRGKKSLKEIDAFLKGAKRLIGRRGGKGGFIMTLVAIAIMITAVIMNSSSPGLDTDSSFLEVEVSKVIDGDTIEFLSEKNETIKVRLIGVNTPERGRPYYKQAADYTKKNLLGKIIYLELDIAPKDKYQRTLAYVWLSPPSKSDKPTDGEIRTKMFNAQILLDGYADIMTIPPNVKYQDYFLKYVREAREGSRGLWK